IDGVPQGKALDMLEGRSLEGSDSNIIGTNSYDAIAASDITIVTAGVPRKPGMSRLDLLQQNAQIITSVIQSVVQNAPDTIILMVSNPVDVMTYLAYKRSGFESHRVVGQAGVLDSSRFRGFIASELGISAENVQAMVLGGHGDSMVPLPRYASVSGIPLQELLPDTVIERLVKRTRKAGGEIISLLQTSSAYYSPASAIVQMTEAILKDKKRIVPASAYLNGQYGLKDIYVGVPVILGAKGVEAILELNLDDLELKALTRSAAIYRDALNKLGLRN
ncbi:MAG: malate dehydrogenase, partial [Candidatus Bathyarchaeota archaeon]|nr:malate dehydrogenase [Candidatus Bathyarchaeota archaeon]